MSELKVIHDVLETFNEDYYFRGKETGVSNYENYRWLPNLTIPLAERLIEVLGIEVCDKVLDFGCARGYLVYALQLCGPMAYGCDISSWAINETDKDFIKGQLTTSIPDEKFDHVIAKDVLEHIPHKELFETIRSLYVRMRKSMLIIVPLCAKNSERYIRDEDELDKTHVIRWTRKTWENYLRNTTGGTVWSSTHIEGIKPASKEVPGSTGFFLIKK